MKQNADYTQEYFDIINSLEGDIPSRRATQDYMRNSTAIVHHEVVESTFVPRLFNEKTYETMEHIATSAHKILEKVMQQYLVNPEYRKVFQIDPRLEELILLPRGYDALLPFARVDIFLNEDDYSALFCEFNADGSSGMNEDREIVNSIEDSAAFKQFTKNHQVRSSELFTTWVEEFLSIYRSYEFAVENPHVVICDFLEHAVIDEFELFADLFSEYGVDCSVCDVRDMRFDGTALLDSKGKRIDAIWRRSVTNDIVEHWDESQNLIDAVRAKKVALIGSFAGHLVHDKQIFQVLFLKETQAFLSDEEIAFIEKTVPFTCFLNTSEIDLHHVKNNKDDWIIKPTDHYGADHVYAGRAETQAQWNELIDRFANGSAGFPFIAQKYCTPFQTQTLVPDIGIEMKTDEEIDSEPRFYNNLSGLYLYNGSFKGVFSRLGPLPTISKDMHGITAATLWVD